MKFPATVLLCLFLTGNLSASESSSLWSFAVIADPHVQGTPEHKIRLQNAVNWINQNEQNKRIRLVFVLGDIAWGNHGEHLREAKEILDGLTVPYIPLIGDNEKNLDPDGEWLFAEVFAPQYLRLSSLLQSWQKAPVYVWNSELEEYCYLQNFSFDYDGVHFIAADFAAREAEDAELYDFEGGTWPWFMNDVLNCQKAKKENIVVFSHPPLCHIGSLAPYTLSPFEFDVVSDFTRQFAEYIYANFAGHLHIDGVSDIKKTGGYKVYLTDALFDDEETIRIVYVLRAESTFVYFHTLHEIETLGWIRQHKQGEKKR